MWEGTLPVDVAENDRSYIVWVDLPGVKKEDVDVAISGREVTVSAQFKRETAVDQGQGREQILRRERPYGMVGRALTFPVELDDAKASADYRDGVLVLTLPKHGSAQIKRLTIH
jgi:HSP20 family protein